MREYERIQTYVYRHARPIELARWRYCFENGTAREVEEALAFYQNPDGGFGHALEPDCWNAHSSPYETLCAMDILEEVGLLETQRPICKGIWRYLQSGTEMEPYGWRFTIPTNDEAPHAPWWSYDEAANRIESLGLTACICAYVLRYAREYAALWARALELTKMLIPRLMTGKEMGEMGIAGLIALKDALKESDMSGVDLAAMRAQVNVLVWNVIERDVEKYKYYGVRPSKYIHDKGSAFYEGNEQIVKAEAEYLLSTLPPEGAWDITWSWHDLKAQYPQAFAISRMWWRSSLAIDYAKFLRAFGYL